MKIYRYIPGLIIGFFGANIRLRVINVVEKGLHLHVVVLDLLVKRERVHQEMDGVGIVFIGVAVSLVVAHGVDDVAHLLEIEVVDVVVGVVVVGGVPGRGHA